MADRFLFSLLKKELRKNTYSNAEEVAIATSHILKAIPEERFAAEPQKLLEHCDKVIHLRGDYVTH